MTARGVANRIALRHGPASVHIAEVRCWSWGVNCRAHLHPSADSRFIFWRCVLHRLVTLYPEAA